MNIIQCDGTDCKKQSPNPETGLHESNHWRRICIEHRNNVSKIILCNECYAKTGLTKLT